MARTAVRLVHISDVHLGAGPAGGGTEARHRRGLADAVDLVHAAGADLLLVVGDFFDSNRADEEAAAFALAELRRAAVPVVILPGNHDALGPGSVYERFPFERAAPNVHVLRDPRGETVGLRELDLALWGRPHHLDEGDFRPLAGLPARSGHRWQLALAHGHLVRDREDLHRSWRIHAGEVAGSGRDYVALGHWDVACRLVAGGTLACYSGSPVHPAWDGGRSGTALLLTLAEGAGVQVAAHRLPEAVPDGGLPDVTPHPDFHRAS